MERKVIVITGPTCSGKTSLSLFLAEKLNTEIISADSRQVYKFLDIGTAKPTVEELTRIKHHFIDSLLPDEDFNVNKFETESIEIINKLHGQGKTPIVVGGSGLYIRALVDGIFNTADTDEEYRAELHRQMEESGKEFLYEQLKKVDPESASKMLPQNWKRVMRALEVFHLTGKPIWQLQEEYKRDINLDFVQYGLNWQREVLYKNIETRVDKMLDLGLVDETKKILEMGYNEKLNSLNTVGYKEIISYLNNKVPYEQAVDLIKRNTRRFAKRQLTWFRRDERIHWFNMENYSDLDIAANMILQTSARA